MSAIPTIPYATPALAERPPAEGKRFLRVIPLAFITYSLAYLDRVNYGFAAARGLETDLGPGHPVIPGRAAWGDRTGAVAQTLNSERC